VTAPALGSTSVRAYERVIRENGNVVPLLGVPLDRAGLPLPPQPPWLPGWRAAGPRLPRGR
jgi:hypothetical protein